METPPHGPSAHGRAVDTGLDACRLVGADGATVWVHASGASGVLGIDTVAGRLVQRLALPYPSRALIRCGDVWVSEGSAEASGIDARGQVVWRAPELPELIAPIAQGRMLVRPSESSNSELGVFDAHTGQTTALLCFDEGFFVSPEPLCLVRDEHAYLISDQGNLWCIDLRRSRVRWTRDVASEGEERLAPIWYDDALWLPTTTETPVGVHTLLIAVDPEDGALGERFALIGDAHCLRATGALLVALVSECVVAVLAGDHPVPREVEVEARFETNVAVSPRRIAFADQSGVQVLEARGSTLDWVRLPYPAGPISSLRFLDTTLCATSGRELLWLDLASVPRSSADAYRPRDVEIQTTHVAPIG